MTPYTYLGVKPRIKRVIHGYVGWQCRNERNIGFGRTPDSAYENFVLNTIWRQKLLELGQLK